jgi:hypothetical protein
VAFAYCITQKEYDCFNYPIKPYKSSVFVTQADRLKAEGKKDRGIAIYIF